MITMKNRLSLLTEASFELARKVTNLSHFFPIQFGVGNWFNKQLPFAG